MSQSKPHALRLYSGPPHNNCRDELQEFLYSKNSLKTLPIENVNVYAGFLMAVGIIGFLSFGVSFSICYMRKKGFSPETQLFKFQKTTKV